MELRLVHVETPVMGKDGEVEIVKTVKALSPEITFSYERDLVKQDIEELAAVHGVRVANNVQLLRSRHHEIARYMAMGLQNNQIAAIFNMAPATISLLKHNPAFVELLSYYHGQRDLEALDIGSRLRAVALDAVDKLQDAIADPEATPAFVLKAATDVLDRIGHGSETKLRLSGGVDINAVKSSYNPGAVQPRPLIDITPPSAENPQPAMGQTSRQSPKLVEDLTKKG